MIIFVGNSSGVSFPESLVISIWLLKSQAYIFDITNYILEE